MWSFQLIDLNQNLSNYCRHKYDQSISQFFLVLFFGGFLQFGLSVCCCPVPAKTELQQCCATTLRTSFYLRNVRVFDGPTTLTVVSIAKLWKLYLKCSCWFLQISFIYTIYMNTNNPVSKTDSWGKHPKNVFLKVFHF